MVEKPKEMSQEEKIRMLNERRDKVIAGIEGYVQGKCKKILLIVQREDDIIMDIPMKGLPNFADERLLMTELIEANMAMRVTRSMEHKIQVMVKKGTGETITSINNLVRVVTDFTKALARKKD